MGVNSAFKWLLHSVTISLGSLSCYRSTVSSKATEWDPVLHYSSFSLLFCLRSSSSGSRLLPRLPIHSTVPSITYFRRQVITQDMTNPISLSPIHCIYNISLIIDSMSNWSSPFFSSTTFQNFPDISGLLSEVSKFQHRTKLCTKCTWGVQVVRYPNFFLGNGSR